MPDTLAEDVFGFESSSSVSAFFVVSVSGLTANPTHGETAQIAERLYASAHHFSDLAPASVTWQWRSGRGDIAGATEAVYVPVPGDNLETIYPVATPLGPYAPQAGPAHVVRFAAPVASGVLPDVSFARGAGEQTIGTADAFTGDYLTFTAEAALPGVTIDRGTGILTVPTGSETVDDITVIATNSGGAAQLSFALSIASATTAPTQMSAPNVTATGFDALRIDLAAAPDDGGSPIIAYDLRFRTGDAAWTVLKDVSDPHVLTGFLADTEYQVCSAAVNAIGRGPWSDSGTARTGKNDLPAIMANAENTVDIVVSDGTFTITVSEADQAHHNGTFGPFDTSALASGPLMVAAPVVGGTAGTGETLTAEPGLWIFPADDAATVTGEWISGGVGTGDTDKSYLTSPGDAGDDVLYRETASNSAGSRSADSNAIGIPVGATVPARMEAPTVTATGTDSIRVGLAAVPNDGGSTITSYGLRYSTDETNWTVVSDVSDPRIVSGLTADTLYYIQTRAVNAVNANPDNWSASGSATTDATSGILWDDQFIVSQPAPMPNYRIGDALTSDTSGAYTRAGGFQHVKVYDIDGVRAIQLDDTQSQVERVLYNVGSVSDDRIVRFVIHRLPESQGGNLLFASYTNESNYIRASIQPDGNWSARAKIGGVDAFNEYITTAPMGVGTEIAIENDTAAETVSFKINGVHVKGSPFSVGGGITGLGAPGFYLLGTVGELNAAISHFKIEEL